MAAKKQAAGLNTHLCFLITKNEHRAMNFADLKTTKKGRIGERIVRGLLEQWNWSYKEAPNRSHAIDFMAINCEGDCIGVEVKTYPRRASKLDTGIDGADFTKYRQLRTNRCKDVLLIFIDQFERCIYGQWLSVLEQAAYREGGKVYFKLDRMRRVRWLTAAELSELSKYPLSAYYHGRSPFFGSDGMRPGAYL